VVCPIASYGTVTTYFQYFESPAPITLVRVFRLTKGLPAIEHDLNIDCARRTGRYKEIASFYTVFRD
jgi:hypothetical protein